MDIIEINKYLCFDKECGKFVLTDEGLNIICNQKRIIRNPKGANEWCHRFVCDLLNLYGGASVYNYELCTYDYYYELSHSAAHNKDYIEFWASILAKKEWKRKAFSMFASIVDDLLPYGE